MHAQPKPSRVSQSQQLTLQGPHPHVKSTINKYSKPITQYTHFFYFILLPIGSKPSHLLPTNHQFFFNQGVWNQLLEFQEHDLC